MYYQVVAKFESRILQKGERLKLKLMRAKRVETNDLMLVLYHQEDDGTNIYHVAKNQEAFSLLEKKILYVFHLTFRLFPRQVWIII